jgi:hypothetical protein
VVHSPSMIGTARLVIEASSVARECSWGMRTTECKGAV